MADPTLPKQGILDVIGFIFFALFHIFNSLIRFVIPVAYEPVKSVKDEIILITGGGSGLGQLLAVKLAKLQAKIVIWDINVKGMEDTVKMVKNVGGTIYSYKCDLCQREDVYKVAEITKKEVGDISILVNNAGVVSGYYLLDTPDHLIQRTFDVNAISHFWTTKSFLPKMIENGSGHIVTIASLAGHFGCPKLVDYCSSKYAAVGFDEALRLELEALGIKNIKTTVVCPYFIGSTGMFNDVVSREPVLSSDYVTDRIVLGILREDRHVMIPKSFRYTVWIKWVIPWPVVSKFMINLVPDACPTPGGH